MKTIIHKGNELSINLRVYANGRTAIQLVTWDNAPYATATVNIPDYDIGKNKVLIKDYSENEGILKALCEAGIVKPTGVLVPTGYVKAHECILL